MTCSKCICLLACNVNMFKCKYVSLRFQRVFAKFLKLLVTSNHEDLRIISPIAFAMGRTENLATIRSVASATTRNQILDIRTRSYSHQNSFTSLRTRYIVHERQRWLWRIRKACEVEGEVKGPKNQKKGGKGEKGRSRKSERSSVCTSVRPFLGSRTVIFIEIERHPSL